MLIRKVFPRSFTWPYRQVCPFPGLSPHTWERGWWPAVLAACLPIHPPLVWHFKALLLVRRWGEEVGGEGRVFFLRGKGFSNNRNPRVTDLCVLSSCLLSDWFLLSDTYWVFFSTSSRRINSPKQTFILGENQKQESLQRAAKLLLNKLPLWPQSDITQTLNSYHSRKGYGICLIFDEP